MTPIRSPRVALFTDSYYEANGVARTAAALEAHAAHHDRPLLVVHGGPRDRISESGSTIRLELRRCKRTSLPLEHDLDFDLAFWRHARQVRRVLREFRPDVLHVTGPSDVGLLGAHMATRLHIPIVGSWHTNLHEYASRRFVSHLSRLGQSGREGIGRFIERHALSTTLRFYARSRVLLAPNRQWAAILGARLRKPVFVMTRGVDTAQFSPAGRSRTDTLVNIGYVGRLSAEKNVRALAAVERALLANGLKRFRMTIVGDGGEREWLRAHTTRATFTGVLRGDSLSAAYADMDLFVFPSETETVGNVVLEALASGVPVIAMAQGGPKFIAGSCAGAVLAHTDRELIDVTVQLVRDAGRRRAMAAATRAHALERSWTAVFDTVYRAYALATALARRDSPQDDEAFMPVAERQSA